MYNHRVNYSQCAVLYIYSATYISRNICDLIFFLLCFLKKKKTKISSSVVYYGPIEKFILRDGIAKLLNQKVTF